jgi:hypothetical protein
MPPTKIRQVAIRLDKTRHLAYGFRAFRAYQKKTGKVLNAMKPQAFGVDELAEILWAGLITEDPELDLDTVDTLMDQAEGENFMEQFQYINEKISEAILEQFGKDVKKKAKEMMEEMGKAVPAERGTGKPSSELPTGSSA